MLTGEEAVRKVMSFIILFQRTPVENLIHPKISG